MADGLNEVRLYGNLGADPELQHTPTGNAVLKMRLATSASFLDRNKVRQERTEWHNVIVWGRRAEALGKILSKGSRLLVCGEIRYSSWEDQNTGQKKYRTDIVAKNIILGGGGSGGRGGSSSSSQGAEPDYGGGYDSNDYGSDGSDDDIPF